MPTTAFRMDFSSSSLWWRGVFTNELR